MLHPGVITYGPRYLGSRLPGRTLPKNEATSSATATIVRSSHDTPSSVRGISWPLTRRSLEANTSLIRRVQSGAGRQSASVRARWVAPWAIAYRMPVSAAAPVPFCGSWITTMGGTGCAEANSLTTSTVRSVELLSTTTTVKSVSSCAAIASRVLPMPRSSSKAGITTQSASDPLSFTCPPVCPPVRSSPHTGSTVGHGRRGGAAVGGDPQQRPVGQPGLARRHEGGGQRGGVRVPLEGIGHHRADAELGGQLLGEAGSRPATQQHHLFRGDPVPGQCFARRRGRVP